MQLRSWRAMANKPDRHFGQEMLDAQDMASSMAASGAAVARYALLVDLAVTCIIIAGMVIDHHSVTLALCVGVAFFLVFGVIVVLALSGTLGAIIVNGQNQRTLRERDRLMLSVPAPKVRVVPALALDASHEEPAALVAETDTFVPAHTQEVYIQAAAWLRTLYGADGLPDPQRVSLSDRTERPGRIRTKHPPTDVRQLLLDRRVVEDIGNGLRLNLPRYGLLEAARRALRG